MSFSLAYLIARFFYRMMDFFHHWYIHGSRMIGRWAFAVFERLDRVFAVQITLRYFFHPLYKDYSIVGRILGIIFRSARVLIGVAVYLMLSPFFLVLYVAWVAIPPLILWNAYRFIQ